MDLTPRLWVLSAARQAGKTDFCRQLADLARGAGWDVAGLLSPAVFESGRKTGILAQDLRSGEQRPLARAEDRPPFTLQLGDWHFDPAVLDWGDAILGSCLPCDLLIVDEIGPLELTRGQGWRSALGVLGGSAYRLGVVVIRPGLQEQAKSLLPIAGTILLEGSVTEENVRMWWNVHAIGQERG